MSTRIFEEAEAPPRIEVADPVSQALGQKAFVRSHRIDLQLDMHPGRSPRLSVSRYYWDAEPPIAVDFVREIRHGKREVDAKRAYCRQRNIRYLLLANEFDEEGVRGKTAPLSSPDEAPAEPTGAPRPPQTATTRRNPTKRR